MRYFQFANRSSSGTRTVSGRETCVAGSGRRQDAWAYGKERGSSPNSLVSTLRPTTEEELAKKKEKRLAKEKEERLANDTEGQEVAQDDGHQSGPWAFVGKSESWVLAGNSMHSQSGKWTHVPQAVSCWYGKSGYG